MKNKEINGIVIAMLASLNVDNGIQHYMENDTRALEL